MSRRSLDLEEDRMTLYRRQHGLCETCNQSLRYQESQLAHRIPEALWAIKKWGMSVIDHPLNKALTHAGACNDAVLIGNDPETCKALVKLIRITMAKGAT